MVTFYVSSSPERRFRASSILNVFVTALIRVVHVVTPGLIPRFIISESTWRSSLHGLKTMDKNPKPWLMKWHTYPLDLAEEHYASEMKILFWATKINTTIATSLMLGIQPEFVIWWRRSISTHVLGASISVKWNSDCPCWNIVLFLLHSL